MGFAGFEIGQFEKTSRDVPCVFLRGLREVGGMEVVVDDGVGKGDISYEEKIL